MYAIVWGTTSMVALLVLACGPSHLVVASRVVFCLSMTICGYLLGDFISKHLCSSIHPVVTCAIVGHVGAGLSGLVEGRGWFLGISSYISDVGAFVQIAWYQIIAY